MIIYRQSFYLLEQLVIPGKERIFYTHTWLVEVILEHVIVKQFGWETNPWKMSFIY